jgi:hypothetical protein
MRGNHRSIAIKRHLRVRSGLIKDSSRAWQRSWSLPIRQGLRRYSDLRNHRIILLRRRGSVDDRACHRCDLVARVSTSVVRALGLQACGLLGWSPARLKPATPLKPIHPSHRTLRTGMLGTETVEPLSLEKRRLDCEKPVPAVPAQRRLRLIPLSRCTSGRFLFRGSWPTLCADSRKLFVGARPSVTWCLISNPLACEFCNGGSEDRLCRGYDGRLCRRRNSVSETCSPRHELSSHLCPERCGAPVRDRPTWSMTLFSAEKVRAPIFSNIGASRMRGEFASERSLSIKVTGRD